MLNIPLNQSSVFTRLTVLQLQKIPTQWVSQIVKKKKQKIFSHLLTALHFASAMAKPCTCRSLCWISLPTGKDEDAGATSTEDSGTSTPTSAMAHTFTFYFAIEIAGTCACNNSCQNSLPVKCANNKPTINKPN